MGMTMVLEVAELWADNEISLGKEIDNSAGSDLKNDSNLPLASLSPALIQPTIPPLVLTRYHLTPPVARTCATGDEGISSRGTVATGDEVSSGAVSNRTSDMSLLISASDCD